MSLEQGTYYLLQQQQSKAIPSHSVQAQSYIGPGVSMEATPSQTGPIDPGTAPLDTLQLDTQQLDTQQLDTKQLRAWPLAIAALALGLLGDLLLFQPWPGLGTTLILLLLPATFGGLLKLHGLCPHGKSLWPLQEAYGFFATMLSVPTSVFLTQPQWAGLPASAGPTRPTGPAWEACADPINNDRDRLLPAAGRLPLPGSPNCGINTGLDLRAFQEHQQTQHHLAHSSGSAV